MNSQDVKDSERFKTSLVFSCFEAFCGPAKFQFSTDIKLNWLLALSSLDQIQPNFDSSKTFDMVESRFRDTCFQTILRTLTSWL